MTALVAVWGGETPDAEALAQRLLHDEPLRVEAGRRVVAVDGIALGVGWSSTSSTARIRPGIACDREENWLVAFDGRLDARADLARACDAAPAVHAAELVAEAFRRWGHDAPSKLEGDFALVAYDRRKRRLVAARDRFGIRPLYWFASGRRVALASTPQALVRVAGAPAAPNPLSLAESLVGDFTEYASTLVRDVHPVRAAHTTVFDQPSTTSPRPFVFWQPDPWAIDRRSRPDELAERLKLGLVESVRERLDEVTAAGVLASGGLDSSSVAGVAARPLGRTDVALVSFVTPGLGCDETPFIEQLSRYTGQRSVRVEPRPAPVPLGDTPWLELYHPSVGFFDDLAQTTRREGLSVVLSGAGSDELQNCTTLETDERIREGDVAGALQYAGLWDEPLDRGGYVRLARSLYRVLAPAPIQRWRRARSRSAAQPWLTPRSREALEAAMSQRAKDAAPYEHPEPLRRMLCEDLTQGAATMAAHPANQRLFGAHGQTLAAPFLDERLVDFLVTLPTSARTEPGLIKPTLRHAMDEALPAGLRWRRNATTYLELHVGAYRALRDDWLELFRESRLEALGLIDAAPVRERIRADETRTWTRWDFTGVLASELWLRQLEAPPPRARWPLGAEPPSGCDG
jgi:asparagine synthase (glutamine-hydrolysing)